MRVLGIETSCDETGIAIYDKNNGLLVNKLYSQIKLHKNYGGVVPELASSNHIKKIIPLLKETLSIEGIKSTDIHGIAYTAGPGLIGSLIIGATIGSALAYTWKIPAIPINHLEAHLLTPMLENNKLIFPLVALLVSGGNTQLVLVNGIGKYRIIGKSLDDSVGETYDKIAKLLGLTYPGGSVLSSMAKKGIPGKYNFPLPMINKNYGLNFSFSGLKTYVKNVITYSTNDEQTKANIARSFEDSIIKILLIKSSRALNKTKSNNLVIAGGVSANENIRYSMIKMMKKRGGKIFYAKRELCTDNGAMIAYTGMIKLISGFNSSLNILVWPKWSLEDV